MRMMRGMRLPVIAAASVAAIVAVVIGCGDGLSGWLGADPGGDGPGALPAGVWCADVDAPAGGDGRSWATAFRHPQAAVDAAFAGVGGEVWVAEGTYTNSSGGSATDTVLIMKGNVHIYGGFAATETARAQRDVKLHPTILDGENTAYHVVYGDLNATLDGFTVTRGNANGAAPPLNYGGGMYNENCSPMVANCRFTANNTTVRGGAMTNISASPTIIRCVFDNNSSVDTGGAIANEIAAPVIVNCIFFQCSARVGGAIYGSVNATPTITNCTFVANTATDWGDALDASGATNSFEVSNSIFTNGGVDEISLRAGATATVTYSNVEGGHPGTGNINADPLFPNAADPDGADDIWATADDGLALLPGSPCIDAADGNTAPATDILGATRLDDIGTTDTGTGAITYADMGAYEFQGTTFVAYYVDATRPDDSGNGLTWATAKKLIQSANLLAASGDEIWVATGTYTNNGGGTATVLVMKDGVEYYGGFAGTETLRTQRDPAANVTTFDGEDTAYHVVEGASNATLDGFTVTRGNANDAVAPDNGGGGLLNSAVTGLTVADCAFSANNTVGAGGAMFNNSIASPTIERCVFDGNTAGYGGAIANEANSSPAIISCVFTLNSATFDAGALRNVSGSSPTVTNCTFTLNTSAGGGVMHNSESSPTFTNCVFFQNTATIWGGAVNNSFASPEFVNCTFTGNSAANGGAIRNSNGTSMLRNCILWLDTASVSGNEIHNDTGNSIASYCDIGQVGGFTDNGGNIDVDPLFVDAADPDGPDDIWGTADDGLALLPGSPCIDSAEGAATGFPEQDILGAERHDDPSTTDGTGTLAANGKMPDMGAYEFQWNSQFVDIGAALPGGQSGDVAWGDYDSDGDLDFVLAGGDGAGSLCQIYRNDGGVFTDIGAGLTGVSLGSLAWGDFDNDGDLDLAVAGYNGAVGRISRIYRNDNGTFADIVAGLTGMYQCSVAWADYDNDGDLDLILSGSEDGNILVSKIYRNDGGGFTDIGAGLVGLDTSAQAWGDYDNDGDLDLAIAGSNGGDLSKIYRNDDAMFVDISAGLVGIKNGALAWGDYDSDGDLDLLLAGVSGGTRFGRIYRNDGGVFTDIGASISGVYWCDLAWGDYDNDGDLDVALTGAGAYTGFYHRHTKVYRNDAGTFVDIDAGLTELMQSSIAWGDYDNDGNLDLAFAGDKEWPIFESKICRNTWATPNSLPSPPSGLGCAPSGSEVAFTWLAATDAETPAAGLTYNLRVGTTSGGNEIVSGHAITSPNRRLIPAMGNVQHNTSWSISNLAPDTYYWSVQTIDTAFAGSAWAPEETFTTDLTLGLVGHWKLDDGPGATALDSAAGGNDGTLRPSHPGNVPQWVSGREGPYALTFDGVDDYVDIPDETPFDITGNLTVAAWIRVASFTRDAQAIVVKGNTAWGLERSGSTDFVRFRCPGSTASSISTLTGVNDGEWHHVAGVYDQSGSMMHVYVDGVLDNSVASSGNIQNGNWQLYIGENHQLMSKSFHGEIDDVRVYNRALGAFEIQLLHTLGLAKTYKIIDLATGAATDAASIPDLLTNPVYKTTKLVLKYIEAGSFQMGDEVGGFDADELPVHAVNITQDYYMGVFEVTQKQWDVIMAAYPSSYAASDRDVHPVEMVSWNDCQSYLTQLSARSAETFRLPTEAEWELACKAGTSTNYSYSDTESSDWMWYTVNAGGTTHEVGTTVSMPNPWGFYDMHGNVYEWCSDWYDNAHYGVSATEDPLGAASGTERVHRGASFGSSSSSCRSAFRQHSDPTAVNFSFGLRVVLDLAPRYKVVDLATGDVSGYAGIPDLLTNSAYKTTKLVLKRIKAGSFTMGDEVGGHDADELPVHPVNITQDYYMGVFEVTQAQWQTITGSNPSSFSAFADSPRRPVEQASWDDCQGYLTQLSALSAKTFRLPTEAEWEYAAKAGTSSNYSYGDTADGAYMWYDLNSVAESHEVGGKLVNPWGIYDMHGNIFEWCQDWYDAAYYTTSPVDDPQGASSGTFRSTRGRSWRHTAPYCRSANRDRDVVGSIDNSLGLRVVLDPQDLVTRGLVGWWKFDETTGTTAADSSGNGNDGTLGNMTGTEWTTGKIGGALEFDGTEDYVPVPVPDPTVLTICMWLDMQTFGSSGAPRLYEGGGHQLAYLTSNELQLTVTWDVTIGRWLAPTSLVGTGWHHVAVSYDGTSVTNDPSIYVDGAEMIVGETSTPAGVIGVYAALCNLGNRTAGAHDRPFDGLMDDVRIYDRVLSAKEIQALFDAGQ